MGATSHMLSLHMTQHILAMNIVAPLAALWLKRFRWPHALAQYWVAATTMQLALLWGWHAPPVMRAAMANGSLMAAMHITLFLSALWFWSVIFAISKDRRWQALFALLITGKLFCLLAVLLVLSRAPLFAADKPTSHLLHAALMADQQLGGLLMLVACPATYLVAAAIIVARWLSAMARHSSAADAAGT